MGWAGGVVGCVSDSLTVCQKIWQEIGRQQWFTAAGVTYGKAKKATEWTDKKLTTQLFASYVNIYFNFWYKWLRNNSVQFGVHSGCTDSRLAANNFCFERQRVLVSALPCGKCRIIEPETQNDRFYLSGMIVGIIQPITRVVLRKTPRVCNWLGTCHMGSNGLRVAINVRLWRADKVMKTIVEYVLLVVHCTDRG